MKQYCHCGSEEPTNEFGICPDCGLECDHKYHLGTCEECGFVCEHPEDEDGVCMDCGEPVIKHNEDDFRFDIDREERLGA